MKYEVVVSVLVEDDECERKGSVRLKALEVARDMVTAVLYSLMVSQVIVFIEKVEALTEEGE